MQFDHRIPAEKKMLVSKSYKRSIQFIKEEISKCDVVCANCHFERTHKQQEINK